MVSMRFSVAWEGLSEFESTLANSSGGTRLHALVALAWQLRQRDSRRALTLLDQAQRLVVAAPGTSALNAALLARMELARSEIGALFSRVDDAEASLAKARALLTCVDDPGLQGDAMLVEAMLAKATGDPGRELAAYENAVAQYDAVGDWQRAGIARGMLALLQSASSADCNPMAGVDEQTRTALGSDPSLDAVWSAARGVMLMHREPAVAADLFLHASDRALQAGMVRHAVISALNVATILQSLADFEGAAACLDEAEQVARRTGWPALLGVCQARIGRLLRDLGHLPASRNVLESALASFSGTPAGINTASAFSDMAQTLLAMGQAQASVEPIATAIGIQRAGRHNDNLVFYLIAQARILSVVGNPDRALVAAAEAQRIIDEQGFGALNSGVSQVLAEIHRLHRLPAPPDMTLPSATVHYAEATLRQGLEIKGWKAPASLFTFLADAWADAGDIGQAYAYARKALSAKEEESTLKQGNPLALLRLLQRHDPASVAAQKPQGGPVAANSFSAKVLTRKEREVLHLLTQSLSNKEIALVLGIAAETVKTHLRSIYAKLEAGSRRHAVARARNLGMLGVVDHTYAPMEFPATVRIQRHSSCK